MGWIFEWARWQVTKPRAFAPHDPSNFVLHFSVRLAIIGAIVPMDKAMKIRKIANVKSLQ
jgi:hypothetical protein